jgi:protein-tyrosine-phosphatase
MTAKQRRDLCRVWKIDPARVELLGNLDPSLTDPPDIVDPWGRPAEIFESVFQRIDRCLETLAGLAYPHRPVAAPAAESGGDIAA